ncbi:MAG TPA: aspartate--tRNA ligase, partial [Acidimicrobiales bacterium]|nr:aspartate--tRNA ligase [Acidimicrobiales bacterium]
VDGAHDVRSEFVLRVTGTVRLRPEGTANPALSTGEVEVADCTLEVLSAAAPPPFPMSDRIDADEVLRLQYRYLDLRRDRMQRNLRLRARVNGALRSCMEEQGFVEVETPMLIASTPEGSRDFIVPSRLQPGCFYALPQSPQLFKQLLMVAGTDRYYQIAHCMRDEDLRADRQFEFTQLDAEMSFADQEDVMAAIGAAVVGAARAVAAEPGAISSSMPRITWQEAMERFGTDKPDVRFAMELVELTDVFAGTEFKAFRAPCVKGLRLPGGGGLTRSRLDALTDRAKGWGAKGLVWMRVGEGSLESPVARFLSSDELQAVSSRLGAEPGDLLLLVADERAVVRHVLGLLRLELGRPPVNEGGLHFMWVTDFPLFEGLDEGGTPIPAHHAFTMPHPDDLERLESDPLSVRSQAYDLVVNGWELGSGSVRIHRPDVQQRVFSLLGIGPEEARAKFGFLLEAFRYGAPPHAGFAFGIDRLVAVLAGVDNIREVIAFPKTQSGADPLTGAPSPVEERLLVELGIRVTPPER